MKNLHFCNLKITRDGPTNRRTDRPTDQPTDQPTEKHSYRDADASKKKRRRKARSKKLSNNKPRSRFRICDATPVHNRMRMIELRRDSDLIYHLFIFYSLFIYLFIHYFRAIHSSSNELRDIENIRFLRFCWKFISLAVFKKKSLP